MLNYIIDIFSPETETKQYALRISDPTYVVTPAMGSRTGRENLKKLFAGPSVIFAAK
jgi:hypothetical protein